MRLATLGCLAAALLCTGCETVVTKATGAWGVPYSGMACGTRMSLAGPVPGTWDVIGAADLTLDLVADTLLLPVDLSVPNSGRVPACRILDLAARGGD